MLFRSFYLLASLTFVLSQGNPNPVVGGDPDDGWHTLPEVIDATAYPDWDVGGGSLVGYMVHLTSYLLTNDGLVARVPNQRGR